MTVISLYGNAIVSLCEPAPHLSPRQGKKQNYRLSISVHWSVELCGLKYWHVSLALAVGRQRAADYRVGTCTNNSFIDVRPQTHHPQASVRVSVCVQRASPLALVQTNYLDGTLAE
jgi:hypothetical protein